MKTSFTILTDFHPAMFAHAEAPLVSLYLRTHRSAPENLQDKTRFKNLLVETEKTLEHTYGKRETAGMVARLYGLLDEDERDIWRFAKEGLAVLADKENIYLYQLDYPVEDSAVVSDRFHITPLIRNFQYGSHYYVLALSAKRFDLYLGDFNSLKKLEMPEGVESDFDKVYDDFDNTSTINVGSFAGMDGRFYGRDSKNEIVEKETQKYFRYVDKTLNEHFLAKHPYPVILVSLTEHQSVFRSVADTPCLLAKGINKPFESMTEDEVLKEAKAIVADIQESSIEQLVGNFPLAHSKERASSDPATIAKALVEKKVSALFVEDDRFIPGTFDKQTGAMALTSADHTGKDNLADEFAQVTYLQGGAVYALDAETMPDGTGVAALFRY